MRLDGWMRLRIVLTVILLMIGIGHWWSYFGQGPRVQFWDDEIVLRQQCEDWVDAGRPDGAEFQTILCGFTKPIEELQENRTKEVERFYRDQWISWIVLLPALFFWLFTSLTGWIWRGFTQKSVKNE